MPIIEVKMWSGRTNEQKKEVIEKITKVFTDMGIPPQAISVIIEEIPMENWGVEGQQCSEKFKDMKK